MQIYWKKVKLLLLIIATKVDSFVAIVIISNNRENKTIELAFDSKTWYNMDSSHYSKCFMDYNLFF